MAKSLLQSFVSGTRQMLTVQLFVSVAVVGVAGWTLAITNDLIRERNSLNERVIQLEEKMAREGIVPPGQIVDAAPVEAANPYPPSGTEATDAAADTTPPAGDDAKPADQPAATDQTPTPVAPTAPAATPTPAFDPAQALRDLFTPAPALANVVLHVRNEADSPIAQRLARELTEAARVRVSIDVMPPRDPRESGYAYFDGRQSRASAAIVQQFNDIARRREIAPWAAQLRGVALPASGEYTADRLDLVLPPLDTPADPRTYRRAPG